MNLSEREARLVINARSLVKHHKVAGYALAVAILAALGAMLLGKLSSEHFGYLVIFFLFYSAAPFPLARKSPSYYELLELIEQKVSESAEAIQVIQNIKNKNSQNT